MTTKIGEFTRSGLPKLIRDGDIPKRNPDDGLYHCPGWPDGRPCTEGVDEHGNKDGSVYKNQNPAGLSAHRKFKHNYKSINAPRYKIELKRKQKTESQTPEIKPKSNHRFNSVFLNRHGKLKEQPEIIFQGVKQKGFRCPVVGCEFVHSHAKWMGKHLRGGLVNGIKGHTPAIQLPINLDLPKLDPRHPPGPRGPYKTTRKQAVRYPAYTPPSQKAQSNSAVEVAPEKEEAKILIFEGLPGCPFCLKSLKKYNRMYAMEQMAKATNEKQQALITVDPPEGNHGQI